MRCAKRIIILLICVILSLSGCKTQSNPLPTDERNNSTTTIGTLDSFSFSFTWNTYGVSSYDSTTGRLVKTSDATNPEDYITTYYLTDAEKQKIYDLIAGLDIASYPDSYDPQNGTVHTEPSITLILSVKTDTMEKTVTAANIADIYEAENAEGQRFLQVCKEIINILTATEEWQALPEYEHLYC